MGGSADADDRPVLRRGPQRHGLPERARALRRLHERGELPRHRRPRRPVRLRRPDLLDRVPRRLADRPLPDRRAAPQPRPLHLRGRGRLPAAPEARSRRNGIRDALGRHLLLDRSDGRGRHADQPDLRPAVLALRRDRRRRHADLPAPRRDDRDHLGADRQGDAVDRRCNRDGVPRPARVRDESDQPVPGRRRASSVPASSSPGASSPTTGTPSRSGSLSCSARPGCRTS